MLTEYEHPVPATEPHNGWHLKKEIQVGHLISTIVIGLGAFTYVADIRKDVEILKVERAAQRDRDDRQDKATAEAFMLMRRQLDKMDLKLDRLMEDRRR